MIKFVYFDVGGVVALDFSGTDKWQQLQHELQIPSERSVEFDEFWQKYTDEVCTGRDVESLLPLLRAQFGVDIDENYSLLIDGFVNRFEKNESIVPVVREIHKRCRIGLLTNMYPRMLDAMQERGLVFDAKWDVIVDSSIKKLVKPDSRIYELAAELAGAKPGEILFVENTPSHIAVAQKSGWQTHLYDPKNPAQSSVDLLTFFSTLVSV
jgi:FMN phosphatase YigB (HAD superfamily)